MISKSIIDLLGEENLEIMVDEPETNIDDTFLSQPDEGSSGGMENEAKVSLSTRKKLQILDWLSIDTQLKSYGFGKVDDTSLLFINEKDKEHIAKINSGMEFDFRSDSIPFAAKYNVAIALSYAEAIEILSSHKDCEIYASEEIKSIFKKYGIPIKPELNKIDFRSFPVNLKRELVWPMTKNLYRALTIRKADQIFPEGVSGKIAIEALMAKNKDSGLSNLSFARSEHLKLADLAALKYSDYDQVYFSDPSDLEIKYHVACYCLEHVSEIKPRQNQQQEAKKEPEDKENYQKIEDEYIDAFKRLNKDKSFWDKISFENILEMGKDVLDAIQEEVRDFAMLRQEIIYRLAGRSKVAIEDDELARIAKGQNPDFEVASRYLDMFFQPSDYYSVLGFSSSKGLTEKEVKDAFKRLAKIYHPDKNPNDPYKDEKEKRFKLLIEAKDSILKQLKSKNASVTGFRDDVSLINYLGNISKLFGSAEKNNQEMLEQEKLDMEEIDKTPIYSANEGAEKDKYLGPYFEEMRVLESMIESWAEKEILILGAGRKPEDFSMPVILSQMGAIVTAIDADYHGPEEYKGCRYYRLSIDRADQMFDKEKFDIVISTAVFGVPFTNWMIRQYALNPFNETFTKRIKELELQSLEILVGLTKKGGLHLHYNKDMNPQSWNFTEEDLRHIGYASAFHPESLPNSKCIWILTK